MASVWDSRRVLPSRGLGVTACGTHRLTSRLRGLEKRCAAANGCVAVVAPLVAPPLTEGKS